MGVTYLRGRDQPYIRMPFLSIPTYVRILLSSCTLSALLLAYVSLALSCFDVVDLPRYRKNAVTTNYLVNICAFLQL
ncbi:hypothetical protein BDW22DRAFT_1363912 [Trametopsis cervina]|nr:hypothetical protein BDW22DRAFT_1363912 [Trametopsis cervina]